MLFFFFSSVTDGWAFTNNFNINQHQSLEDRLSAAQVLVEKEPLCPVVVDEMNDVTAVKYGALPERLYVLQVGKVVYKVRSVHHLHHQLLYFSFYVTVIRDFPRKVSRGNFFLSTLFALLMQSCD